jgi:hypothetical protein
MTAPTAAVQIVAHPLTVDRSGAYSNFVPGRTSQQAADSFVLSSQTTLDGLSWYGQYRHSGSLTDPVAFSIRFFADAGGLPSISPLWESNATVNAQDTGLTYGGFPWYSYSSPLTALVLDPRSYWLSVRESDPRSDGGYPGEWLWGSSNTGAHYFATRNDDANTWQRANTWDMAFSLSGEPVPEPSTFALLGTGAAGLLGFAWRWRKRTVRT